MANDSRDPKQRFADLSHDMRTPLSVIAANAQLIVKVLDKPESVNRLSAKIVENVERIVEMIVKFETEL